MSVADVERGFSALKLITNSMRHALKKNLNHAMMGAIKGENSKRIDFDGSAESFKKLHKRRVI